MQSVETKLELCLMTLLKLKKTIFFLRTLPTLKLCEESPQTVKQQDGLLK